MTIGPLVCGTGTLLLAGVECRLDLLDGRAAGHHGLRPRPDPARRAAHRDRPRRRPGPLRRCRERRQQRRRPGGQPPRRRRAAGGRRAERLRLRRRRGVLVGLPARDAHLRRDCSPPEAVVSWLLIRNPSRAVGTTDGADGGRAPQRAYTAYARPRRLVVRRLRGLPGHAHPADRDDEVTTSEVPCPGEAAQRHAGCSPGRRTSGSGCRVRVSGRPSSLRGCRCCRRSPGTPRGRWAGWSASPCRARRGTRRSPGSLQRATRRSRRRRRCRGSPRRRRSHRGTRRSARSGSSRAGRRRRSGRATSTRLGMPPTTFACHTWPTRPRGDVVSLR